MDLCCYAAHWVRALVGEEPALSPAVSTLGLLGADLTMDADLVFPSGVTARVASSVLEGVPLNTSLEIVGTRGSVRVDNLGFPSIGHSIRGVIDGVDRSLTVRGAETYDHQLDAIIRRLASGEPLLTEGDDPIGNMVVIDAIYAEAARGEAPQRVAPPDAAALPHGGPWALIPRSGLLTRRSARSIVPSTIPIPSVAARHREPTEDTRHTE